MHASSVTRSFLGRREYGYELLIRFHYNFDKSFSGITNSSVRNHVPWPCFCSNCFTCLLHSIHGLWVTPYCIHTSGATVTESWATKTFFVWTHLSCGLSRSMLAVVWDVSTIIFTFFQIFFVRSICSKQKTNKQTNKQQQQQQNTCIFILNALWVY